MEFVVAFYPPFGAKSALLIVLFNDLGKPYRTKDNFLTLFSMCPFFCFFVSFCFVFLETKYYETEIFSDTGTFFSETEFSKSDPKKISETKLSKTETETLKKFANVLKSRGLKYQSAQVYKNQAGNQPPPNRQRVFIAGLPLHKGGRGGW